MDGWSWLALLGVAAVIGGVIWLAVGRSTGLFTAIVWAAFTLLAAFTIVTLVDDGVQLGEVLLICAMGVLAIPLLSTFDQPSRRR